MSFSNDQRVTVKMFIGYPVTSEIRMLLRQSTAWKNDKITHDPNSRELVEAPFQEQEFIGRYISAELLTLKVLKELEVSVKISLIHYCPDIAQESLNAYVFPQLFIN